MFESARKKLENYHRSIASEQKQRRFEEVRQRMLEAQRREDYIEEQELTVELMQMFATREDYERTMHLYEEYERDRQQYMDEMERMEEESNNYQQMMMRQEMQRKQAILDEFFDEM
jgi:hypothetical protein